MTDADWVQQERDHEYRMASLKEEGDRRRRDNRTERFVAFAWAVGIVGVVAIVAWGILALVNSTGERGQKAELACVESGGSWTGLNGGGPLCVSRIDGTQ